MNPCSICWHSCDALDNCSPSCGVHVCVKLHIMHTFCVDTDAGGECLSFSVSPKHLPALLQALRFNQQQLVITAKKGTASSSLQASTGSGWSSSEACGLVDIVYHFFLPYESCQKSILCEDRLCYSRGESSILKIWVKQISTAWEQQTNDRYIKLHFKYILRINLYFFLLIFFHFWIFNLFIGELQLLSNKQ